MPLAAKPELLRVTFPSDMEYIPSIRKFVSDLALVAQHTPRFAFRTELVVDEICSNAVKHGSLRADSTIHLTISLYPDRLELSIHDTGGKPEDISELKKIIYQLAGEKFATPIARGRGLAIVKTLANNVLVNTDQAGMTEVKIIKFREDTKEDEAKFFIAPV